MPTYRVWHAAAGTRDGLTWDTAYARLADAYAVGTAGDTFLVHNAHVGDLTGLTIVTNPGTIANPCNVYCVDKDNADVLSTGAIESLQGTWTLYGNSYYYGIRFDAGTTTLNQQMIIRPVLKERMVFEKCEFRLNTTSVGGYVSLGNAHGVIEFRQCTFRFQHANQNFRTYGKAIFYGCSFSVADSGVLPTTALFASQTLGETFINGVDFSAFTSGFSFGVDIYSKYFVTNCKMPAGWTGPTATITGVDGSVICSNCWTDSDNWRHQILTYAGLTTTDNTVYKTGGATDGVTGYSWKVVTSAVCSINNLYDSPDILFWNSGAGSAQTVTVEVACDKAVALTNADACLVAEYLGTSTSTLSSFLSDAPGASSTLPFGSRQGSSAAQTTDAVSAWTGTGGWTNAKRQSLSVTITPQMIGWHRLMVRSETPSLTFYVNPSATVA